MTIRYLRPEEKKKTLPLWPEAFPEETDRFLQYYYTEKTRDNKILAAEDETGYILSMLHRNPYKVQAGKQIWDIDYIVAVATAKERRHQGLMRELLTHMVNDMYREKMGFCFLMPADEKIYEPFDFVTICRQPCLRLNEKGEACLEKERVRRDGTDAHRAAAWMNEWLKKRYHVFAIREPEYVNRLIKELESEDGWMELLILKEPESGNKEHGKGQIQGVRCWWGIGKKDQRMLLTSESFLERGEGEAPVIMARIVHLEKFLTAIRLSADCRGNEDSLKVCLKVEDAVCRGNNGVFLWEIDHNQSSLRPWESGMQADERLDISIAGLARRLFGREKDLYGSTPRIKKFKF